jgi:zinc D-Ala-D-Ala carboxypeptidase
MKLSKNLRLAEMIRSESAKRLGISNQPTEEHIENMKRFAMMVFEPIRARFDTPIYISSGYRSEKLNKAIKGSLTSQHCSGEAADIDMDGSSVITNADVFHYIKDNLEFDQLIWEFGDKNNPDWVHVSYKDEGNRKEVLAAYREEGKTKYKKL